MVEVGAEQRVQARRDWKERGAFHLPNDSANVQTVEGKQYDAMDKPSATAAAAGGGRRPK